MGAVVAPPPVFVGLGRKRPEWSGPLFLDHATSFETVTVTAIGYMNMKKSRQLFLRSYRLSRKKTNMEKLRSSAVRLRRLVWVRLRAARRLLLLSWYKLRLYGGWRLLRRRRMRFQFNFQRLGVRPNHGGYTPIICGGACHSGYYWP